MNTVPSPAPVPPTARFAPKFLTTFEEGYGLSAFRADAVAGLTVAIVALPLSMAIAIASGAGPERGLFTAIVGGFIISALGGSRFQIGGPAGAFIVLVAATIERHSLDGLFLATMISGLILLALGVFRLGTLIKFIPQPVTVGFTAGIAMIIFASQLKELLGLTLVGPEPAALLPKLAALGGAIGTVNGAALGVAALCLGLILILRHFRPGWPGFLIAVAVGAIVTALFDLPVETIATKFGGIPNALPAPQLPPFSIAKVEAVLPDAIAIALLGAIESLLSAVVADGMSGRRHRSNTELVAQGVGNLAAPLFGGLPVTGTIARTATNVRAGAHGPVSGMLHALYLLLFMLLAAPLLARIPLAALGAVLVIVAWNMAERHAVAALLRGGGADAAVMLATFFLTVFRDLTEGILVGVLLGAVLFAVRMAQLVEVSTHRALLTNETEEGPALDTSGDVIVYRLSGPLFFGSTPLFAEVLGRLGVRPKAIILDLTQVPLMDASGAQAIDAFLRGARSLGAQVLIAGAPAPVMRSLVSAGIGRGRVKYVASVERGQRFAARWVVPS